MSLHKWIGMVGAVALVGAISVSSAQAQQTTTGTGSTPDSMGGKMDSTGHHHHGMMKGGYMATLASPSSGTAGGSAWVNGTKAGVKITGDSAGATRPWHVHKGSCGNDQGIFGDASAYKPITIGSDGNGKGMATLSMALPDTGSYFVNIHASSSDMKTIIACGPLTKGK